MKRLFSMFVATVAIGLATSPSEATLTTIGTADYGTGTYNLIYDDHQGLIWLDYSNAATTWQNQMNWAASLNNQGVLTYNIDSAYTLTWGSGDWWRLPQVVATTSYSCNWAYSGTNCGYNVDTATGEMAHLYYDEFGNLGYYDTSGVEQPGWGLTNTGPFNNLRSDPYWSSYYYPNGGVAWFFGFDYGAQYYTYKDTDFYVYALAVRPGEVTLAPTPEPTTESVPEPGTMLLMGSGLAGLAFWRRFKKG